MDLLQEYLIQWIGSNSIAILLLIAAIKRPKLGRLLFALLFAWASWINYVTAHNSPEEYLNYALLTPFDLMRDFINGWFKENIILMVTLISFGQGLIAIGMMLKSWYVKIACIGAIVFLLAITPLGIGSGFPCSIIAAVAIYIILKKNNLNYLWKLKATKTNVY
jgi:hypothetical protein